MEQQTVRIKFEGVPLADRNRYAEDLLQTLASTDRSIRISREREDPASQDFGATLVLVLGTPAVLALARGVAKWLTRNNAVSICFETPSGGQVAIRNLESQHAAQVVQAFLAGGSGKTS